MKETAIQQAIVMVRNRIDSQIDTLMGKHTIHHLQQIERGLYDLIDVEKEQQKQMLIGLLDWMNKVAQDNPMVFETDSEDIVEMYYDKTYGKK
jgi:predicted component of type VI protein secretion system